jgi:hypothetical protein
VTRQRLFQEGTSGKFITSFRDTALQDFALVVHGAPHIMLLAIDLDDHLIEVSLPVAKAAHPIDALSTYIDGEQRPEVT